MMANISESHKKSRRDISYFRQRFKNRLFGKLANFFVEEAARTGVTKSDIAFRLDKDPSQITRWLSNPGNLTLDTISDLLLAMDAEAEPPAIIRFSERTKPNYAHPLIARATGVDALKRPVSSDPVVTMCVLPNAVVKQTARAGSGAPSLEAL